MNRAWPKSQSYFLIILIFILAYLPGTPKTQPPSPSPDEAARGVPEERRVALVLRNGAYTTAGRLKNPVNDAAVVAGKLTRLGFEVVEPKSGSWSWAAASSPRRRKPIQELVPTSEMDSRLRGNDAADGNDAAECCCGCFTLRVRRKSRNARCFGTCFTVWRRLNCRI